MTDTNIYKDIAQRTGGDIYIGVVGPVRTGKSTFIKRFMDTLVMPNIDSEYRRDRATDEMPQSAAGRTIMTTEPKFIPEQAVRIKVDGSVDMSVRLIDCVGYILPSALGYIEDDHPRMVKTPWFEEEIPFNMAAEIGTRKVITEHSTIGLLVTTDGSITDLPREEYREAEMRVVAELQEINKPFVVLLNSLHPDAPETKLLAAQLQEEYGVPVCAVNCLDITEEQIGQALSQVLTRFPVREIAVQLPGWLTALPKDHAVRRRLFDALRDAAADVRCMGDVATVGDKLQGCDVAESVRMLGSEMGIGKTSLCITVGSELFYHILSENTGLTISDESDLMRVMSDLAAVKKKYAKIRNALDEVEATGYGIVMPESDELTLEEPEIIRQNGRYGVRLRAEAPSIHMLKANITTEVSPIVGSERQSEELVNYLLREFEEDPSRIWESNIFGTSLYGLVGEGLNNKLYRMPEDARMKLKETVERIINEGCSGLICIIV